MSEECTRGRKIKGKACGDAGRYMAFAKFQTRAKIAQEAKEREKAGAGYRPPLVLEAMTPKGKASLTLQAQADEILKRSGRDIWGNSTPQKKQHRRRLK